MTATALKNDFTASASWPGEYFDFDEVGRLSTYYKSCGPMPVGDYIRGLANGEIHIINGVRYIQSRIIRH